MGFLIGRNGARETYPTSPGAAGGAGAYAANFAQGPESNTLIVAVTGSATQAIVWAFITSGAGGSPNVPITPKVTGSILMNATVQVENTTGAAVALTVQIINGGTALGEPLSTVTVPANGFATVPFQYLLNLDNAVGVKQEFGIAVSATSANALTMQVTNSTLSLQEVPAQSG